MVASTARDRISAPKLAWIVAWFVTAVTVRAQFLPGEVVSEQKISATVGSFENNGLITKDFFGRGVASCGDLDGDGVTDVLVGEVGDLTDLDSAGAIWILFLNADGTVKASQKINNQLGGFTGELDDFDHLGGSLAFLGDLDGDGYIDIVAGAAGDDDGGVGSGENGPDRGALWIVFLDADMRVKSQQKISDTAGNFTAALNDKDAFGVSVTSLGDLDGDGVVDLAVGASGDDTGGDRRGAVYVLFLERDGTVKSHQKISDLDGGFAGVLDNNNGFGISVASLGDLDGDELCDLAVGAHFDDDGALGAGAVWVLFLNANGTVKSHQKISATEGGFRGALGIVSNFGSSMDSLRDFDGDGVVDLVVGGRGAVWVVLLTPDGTVKGHLKINAADDLVGPVTPGDNFGVAVARLPDLDGDGVDDIAVGATGDIDGSSPEFPNVGALWILSLTNGQWVDLGQSLHGTPGAPQLSGDGVPLADEQVTLSLQNALGNAAVFRVISTAVFNAPFAGGTLVPDPDQGIVFVQTTGAAGSIQIIERWPTGIPPGSTFYFQDWIKDPGGPAGFAASNAMSTTTP